MAPETSIKVIASELGNILEEKNKSYGSAFTKVKDFLTILYPNGIPVESYGDMVILVRIFDKMMRIANDPEAFNEDPYKDIAGYGLLKVWEKESNKSLADKMMEKFKQ